MSSKEYQRIKVAMGWLLNKATEQIAKDLDFNIYWRDQQEPSSELYYYYHREVSEIYEKFSDSVEALYPGDYRKLNDAIQYLDEKLEEQMGKRATVQNGR